MNRPEIHDCFASRIRDSLVDERSQTNHDEHDADIWEGLHLTILTERGSEDDNQIQSLTTTSGAPRLRRVDSSRSGPRSHAPDILRASYDHGQGFPVDSTALLLKIVNRVADPRRGLTICSAEASLAPAAASVNWRRRLRIAA